MSIDEMLEDIDESWNDLLKEILKKELEEIFLKIAKTQYQPKGKDIFNVFNNTQEKKIPISDIKVVILGQDPYSTKGKATGYAFAVPPEFGMQGSLSVIREEIEKEFKLAKHSYSKEWKTLKHWRDSGVFLLNTALTVKIGEPRSHLDFWINFTEEKKGFTNKVIEYISKKQPCIWMLWGEDKENGAQRFEEIIHKGIPVNNKNIEEIIKKISNEANYILKAPHPSPFPHRNPPGHDKKYVNRLFCNNGHNNFLYANKILNALYGKEKEIKW